MALKRLYEKTQLSFFAFDDNAQAQTSHRESEGFRLEQESLDFHNRVYEGYRELARAEPERWHIIDASKSTDEVRDAIWEAVSVRLAELEAAG